MYTHTHIKDAALVCFLLIAVIKTLTYSYVGKKGGICFILHHHSLSLKGASQEPNQGRYHGAGTQTETGGMLIDFTSLFSQVGS